MRDETCAAFPRFLRNEIPVGLVHFGRGALGTMTGVRSLTSWGHRGNIRSHGSVITFGCGISPVTGHESPATFFMLFYCPLNDLLLAGNPATGNQSLRRPLSLGYGCSLRTRSSLLAVGFGVLSVQNFSVGGL